MLKKVPPFVLLMLGVLGVAFAWALVENIRTGGEFARYSGARFGYSDGPYVVQGPYASLEDCRKRKPATTESALFLCSHERADDVPVLPKWKV